MRGRNDLEPLSEGSISNQTGVASLSPRNINALSKKFHLKSTMPNSEKGMNKRLNERKKERKKEIKKWMNLNGGGGHDY